MKEHRLADKYITSAQSPLGARPLASLRIRDLEAWFTWMAETGATVTDFVDADLLLAEMLQSWLSAEKPLIPELVHLLRDQAESPGLPLSWILAERPAAKKQREGTWQWTARALRAGLDELGLLTP